MKALVKVTLKKGVLDPQGKAISHALHTLGFSEVGNVRQGMVIEIEIPDGTTEARLREMCEQLLANPVMEDYQVEIA